MARRCSVCCHPQREDIDRELVTGTALRTIADRWSVSKTALIRHRQEGHVAQAVAKAADAAEVAHGETLMEKIKELVRRAETTLDRAEKGTIKDQCAAIREARETIKLLAQVAGELDSAPTVNLVVAPEWVALRGKILVALAPFPEARQAVASAIEARCA